MPSNPYYQEDFQGQAGQTAKAEQVKSEFDGVQAGFDAVLVFQNSAIQGQPGETLTILPAAATRANKWLRFDASGNPILNTAPFTLRGAWAPNTLYHSGDAYTYAPNNSVYFVTTQYTSGSTYGSTDTANTLLLVNLGGLYFVNNVLVTGPATLNAVDGGSYLLDSTGGAITVNLPTESALGNSPINLTYVGGSLVSSQTQAIVSASGQFIMGNSNNQVNCDVANYSVSMMWAGAPYGWRFRTMG